MIKISGNIHDFKLLTAYVDGGCEPVNPGGVCSSAWVIFADNVIVAESYEVVLDGGKLATNNFAEYKALELLLKWLYINNWKGNLEIKSDSQLVVNQVNEKWKINAPNLKPIKDSIIDYINLVKNEYLNLVWVGRNENKYADNLCEKSYNEYIGKKEEESPIYYEDYEDGSYVGVGKIFKRFFNKKSNETICYVLKTDNENHLFYPKPCNIKDIKIIVDIIEKYAFDFSKPR